jgi:tetratricopeptide (TPR) repeat protein
MIRAIAFAGVLGTLTAGGLLYAAGNAIEPGGVANWIGRPGKATGASVATEYVQICSTMASMGSESDWKHLDPDFGAGKKALAAGDWSGAIAALKLAALRDPRNADIQNYIGYAYRRLHQLGPAMGYYQKALESNPRHRSAHEHLGELFLVLGEPAKAQEHFEALARICLIPCDELADLERLMASYRKSAAAR